MTFAQLKYALTLQKYGTFKQAAIRLNITQPGLSLQIQKLEESVGIMIFDRSVNPVSVTSEGEEFLRRAAELIAGVTNLEKFSFGLGEGYRGRVKLGIIPTLAPFLVPLFVDELQQEYPHFKLDIHELLTAEVIQGVRSGELDAGLISTPYKSNGIQVQELFYERFYLYSSEEGQASDLKLTDINYDRLWLLNEGNCFRDQVSNFCDLNKIRKDKAFVYRSNSIDALIRIVDAKGGVTIMPELTTLSLNANQENNYSPILKKAREISLISRQVANKGRFFEVIARFVRENVPSHMLSQQGLEIVDPGIRDS